MANEASNPVSFLPEDYLEKKAQRRANVLCAILAVTVIATIGAAFMVTQRMNRAAEDEHATLQIQYAQATEQIRKVNQLQEKQQKLAQEAEVCDSLLEKVPRSNLLAAVTNALPDGVSLLDFHLEAKRTSTNNPHAAAPSNAPASGANTASAAPAIPNTPPLLYDVDMKLTGIANSDLEVSDYIGQLNRCKLLKDVNLTVTDEYQMADRKMRKFELAMTLDPTARVQSPADQTLGSIAQP